MHTINVIISQTDTIPAKAIRFVTKSKYSHTSICFDDNFDTLYSFARKKADNPLVGGFIKEHPAYLSLGKTNDVNVIVYKIPVDDSIYYEIIQYLKNLEKDGEYMYNLFSVALYPIHLDFSTYKAYHCTEFAVKLLEKYHLVKLTKKAHRYSPKDISILLKKYFYYQGSIKDLSTYQQEQDEFFKQSPFFTNLKNTTYTIFMLLFRKIRYHDKPYSW